MTMYGAVKSPSPVKSNRHAQYLLVAVVTGTLAAVVHLRRYSDATEFLAIKSEVGATPWMQLASTAGIDEYIHSCGSEKITVTANPGECRWTDGASPAVQVPSAWDNVGWWKNTEWDGIAMVTPEEINLAKSNYAVGLNNVTFTATDGHGNTAECYSNVLVTDNEPPVVQPPYMEDQQPATAEHNFSTPTECSLATTFKVPAFVDNCQGSGTKVAVYCYVDDRVESCNTIDWGTTGYSETPGDSLSPILSNHKYEIAYWSTDKARRNATLRITANYKDTSPPTVGLLDMEMVAPENGQCINGQSGVPSSSALLEIKDHLSKNAKDNCGLDRDTFKIVTDDGVSVGEGTPFGPGITNVTVSVDDLAGNFMSETITVRVVDITRPTIQCPAGVMQFNVSADTGTAIVSWDEESITASDNSCGLVQKRLEDTLPANGGAWRAGEYAVMYVVTDVAGHTADCEIKIEVWDYTAPVFVGCPDKDLEIPSLPRLPVGVVTLSLSAMDVGDQSSSEISYTPFNPSGYPFPLGKTEITAVAEDASGNTQMCAFFVNVEDKRDPYWTQQSQTCSNPALDGKNAFAVGDYKQCGGVTVNSQYNNDKFDASYGTNTIFDKADVDPFSADFKTCCDKDYSCQPLSPYMSSCLPTLPKGHEFSCEGIECGSHGFCFAGKCSCTEGFIGTYCGATPGIATVDAPKGSTKLAVSTAEEPTNGDTVNINGEKYTVTSVIADFTPQTKRRLTEAKPGLTALWVGSIEINPPLETAVDAGDLIIDQNFVDRMNIAPKPTTPPSTTTAPEDQGSGYGSGYA